MSKCDTCKHNTEDEGWMACGSCIHEPGLKNRYEQVTNADRIRAMTDEELAEIIMCPYGNGHNSCIPGASCLDCCLKWLKQPCEDSPTVEKG